MRNNIDNLFKDPEKAVGIVKELVKGGKEEIEAFVNALNSRVKVETRDSLKKCQEGEKNVCPHFRLVEKETQRIQQINARIKDITMAMYM